MKRILFLFSILALFPAFNFSQTGEAALAEEYFNDAEYESALELYVKLNKENPDQELFINRAYGCYTFLGKYEEGIKFMDKVIKSWPGEYVFNLMKAELMSGAGQKEESAALVKDIIYKKLSTEKQFTHAGSWLSHAFKNDLAIECYTQARKILKSPRIFSVEMAQLRSAKGQYADAAKEYINYYLSDPMTFSTVSVDLVSIVNSDSKDAVEMVLIEASQQNQKDIGLRTFLYEFYLQTEDFTEAFVQVKSLDKLFGEEGTRVYEFANTLRGNKQYALSAKALDYIIEAHPESRLQYQAYQDKTIINELEAFESLPLDTNAIRKAVNSYEELLTRFGRKSQFFDAMYRKANLSAFYLFDLNSAKDELDKLLAIPLGDKERAQANLLMGDVYLMQKDFNKAKLKYTEVAEAVKDGQIGALAKFKEGRMSYFKGDFEIAKARLTSIKDNTSNDISNDAIQLYLVIQENTGMDSNTTALQMFANAQLMIFQRDYDPALVIMDSILYTFPSHPLTDNIIWEKANIALQRRETEKAVSLLDKILENHHDDIMADDALYTKAKIYDYTYKDPTKAMELYIQFLKEFPGSLFIVECRKRIREMRERDL